MPLLQLTDLDSPCRRIRLRAGCSGCAVGAYIDFGKIVRIRPDRIRDGAILQRIIGSLRGVNAMLRPKSKQFLFGWEAGYGSGNASAGVAEILRSRQFNDRSICDFGDWRAHQAGHRSLGAGEECSDLRELRKITGG